MRRIYSQQLAFRLGGKLSSIRSVVLYMIDARWAQPTTPKSQMRRVYSQQLVFRLGGKLSSIRSVVLYMTDARWAQPTTPKNQMRRVNELTDKPGSVVGNHSSQRIVTNTL